MSHSKKTKRGKSLYLDTWHREGRRFVVTCALCGREGYSPSILEEGFEKEGNVAKHEHSAVAAELMRIYKPLPLDALGRCEVCARAMDRRKEEDEE